MSSEQNDNDMTRSYSVIPEGTVVSHYRVEKRIGVGGMGEIFLAQDVALSRKVALKFLSHELTNAESARSRFIREAQSAAALSHPNIVTIYEVGEYNGRPFFAMEYLEGLSLRDIIRSGDLSMNIFVDIAVQICNGLREAHDVGVVHRDIKPSNIVADRNGRCVILDFGLATILGDERLTESGSALGTVGYMSPEQVKGEQVDHRSDIFSAGAVLYEMLTCRQPFRKETEAATLHAIVAEEPEPVARYKSGVPEDLQRIIDKALEKNPELRYQHIDEVLADLKRVRYTLGGDTTSVSRSSLAIPAKPVPRHIKLTGLAAIILLTLALIYPTSRQAIERLVGLYAVPTDKHLAILPFTNLGGTEATQAFCDGIMETMSSKITQLEKYHGSLWVVPASEVRSEGISSPREARKAFGVTLAVTGSVQWLGDKMRMTLNLVNAETERNIWSTVIDDSVSNLSALQDSTVMVLAGMLDVHLRPEQRRVLTEGGTTSPKAYEYYLEARGYLQNFESKSNVENAIAAFEKAIEEDQDFALAYAGLGEAHWHNYEIFGESESEQLAIYNSRRAVEMTDKLAPVHIAMGIIHKRAGRYEEAAREFEKALNIDPNNRQAYWQLAMSYDALDSLDLAESAYMKAISLKPDHWAGYWELGYFYVTHGRPQDALDQLNQVIDLDPEGFAAWNNLGASFYYLGQTSDARRMWERSFEIEPNYGACSNLGLLYHLEGSYAEAALMYERALQISDHDYQVWGNLASAYDWIPGRHKDALRAYERAIQMAEEKRQVNPRDPEVLSALAEYYAAIGDRDKAVSSVNQLVSLEPGKPELMVTVGLVYEVLGDRREALKWVGKALEQGCPRSQIESIPEFEDLILDPQYREVLGTQEGAPHGDSGSVR